MEKKIIYATGLVMFSVAIFVLVYLVFVNRENQVNDVVDKINSSGVDCGNYNTDQFASTKAIESVDINICECIKDNNFKAICRNTINDLGAYAEAIRQYNPKICDEIQDLERKEACTSVTVSGIEDLQKNDPQYLADIYASKHNEGAIFWYESLLQKDPTNIKNLIALSLSYAEKGLNEQEQGRDHNLYVEKALVMAERAGAIDANNAEVYRVKGYIYEIKPDYNQSIMSYNRAIELDQQNVFAYIGRGHVYNMFGMLENAQNDFKKAAELDVDKKEVAIYSNLCRLESSRDDLIGDAIKNCEIVVNGDFQDPVFKSESNQILSTIYIKNKNYTQAENYLMKAKSLTPNDPNLYVAISDLYINIEDYVMSEKNAREAVRLSPTKASAHKALAYSLYRQKKYQEAIGEVNNGLQLVEGDVSLLEPNKPVMKKDLYYILVNVYNAMGDTKNEMRYKEMGDHALID
jgi:tetratricopeptide (TPR) repeat protein